MGFKVIVERDIVNWTTTTIYKCSNCETEILRTPPIRNGEYFSFDWDNISHVCPCGEILTIPVSKFMPVIDEIENIEV